MYFPYIKDSPVVTDKKNYIKNFCYPKTMTSSEVSDHLWKEIQLSTGIKLEDDQDKENASSNPQNWSRVMKEMQSFVNLTNDY